MECEKTDLLLYLELLRVWWRRKVRSFYSQTCVFS